MKMLNSVFLLLAISFVTVYSIDLDCPADNVFGKTIPKCKCSKPPLVITCTNINQEWLKNFEPEKLYNIETLQIKDSPDLPFIADKFHYDPTKSTGIIAKTVSFTLSTKPNFEKHALSSLLSVASDTIIVKSTYSTPIVFNVAAAVIKPIFKTSLKTIVFENVQITESKGNILENIESLNTLQFKKVSFTNKKDKMVIKGPTRVEIIESTSLPTLQYVPPSTCTEEIVLNLQKNSGFTDLDMSSMFDKNQLCKYYIDLSESQLQQDFLTSKKDVFNKITKEGQIFLIMRETKGTLNCDGCFRDWYKKMAKYVHSVYCKGKKSTKYIDQLLDSEFDACK